MAVGEVDASLGEGRGDVFGVAPGGFVVEGVVEDGQVGVDRVDDRADPVGVDTLVVDAWGHHGHSPRRGEHVALVVIAVAHHQPPPVLVNLIGELLDIGGHLSAQRRRQHLPGTITNDLVEQRLGPTRRKPVSAVKRELCW
jgi:hypothetical protein